MNLINRMSAPLQFLLDTREHGLSTELTRFGLPYVVKALDVGDFMIQTAEGVPLLVGERKSFADFAASNNDGRYREQRARLMATRGQGVAVLYVLEGTWSPLCNRTFCNGRTTESTLQRLTSRLILRYGMPVLASANIAETAQWCQRLLEQLTDDPAVFQPESGLAADTTAAMATYAATFHTVKKSNKGPGGVAQGMISAIPGLGEKRVTALLEQTSIAKLCAMSASDISALVVGGKRLGDKLGAAIVEALHWSSSQ